MFTRGFVVAAAGLAIMIGASQASAQQFNQPFHFRVHNNVAAMNMAVILRDIQNGGSSSSSSSGSNGSSPGSATYNLYSSSTVGNMNEITTILEQGAQGWVNLDVGQDGSGSSQSSTTEGTQLYGGTNAIGGGDATTVVNEGNDDNNGSTE